MFIKVDTFSIGQKVRVTGKSIGKGFAGNQKRNLVTENIHLVTQKVSIE